MQRLPSVREQCTTCLLNFPELLSFQVDAIRKDHEANEKIRAQKERDDRVKERIEKARAAKMEERRQKKEMEAAAKAVQVQILVFCGNTVST